MKQENLLYAMLGGATAGVAVGMLSRYTSVFAVSQGESEREAVARLLARSGAVAVLGGAGLAFFAKSEGWAPLALGAVGAGTLLMVSGVTMSKDPAPSLPAQIASNP